MFQRVSDLGKIYSFFHELSIINWTWLADFGYQIIQLEIHGNTNKNSSGVDSTENEQTAIDEVSDPKLQIRKRSGALSNKIDGTNKT